MELTKGQENALKVAVERYKNHEAYTVIAGPAGSGKTSLVQYIIEELHLKDDEVVFTTFTGKASLVLMNKGCSNACTLHKLLYNPRTQKDGSVKFEPKTQLDFPYKLIVVDEVSMVSAEIFDLLLSHHVPVLCLGDDFQLPAIGQSCNVLDNPHAKLTEILRQALESNIIRMADDIRNGRKVTGYHDKDARVFHEEDVTDKLLLGADMIVCAKNITRNALNEHVRKIKYKDNYTIAPVNGDKIMTLKNAWDVMGSNGTPIVNGSVGYLSGIEVTESKLYHPDMHACFKTDFGEEYKNLHMDYKLLTTGEPTITKDNWMKFPKRDRPLEICYSYAATGWKLQGSEFDRVVVYLENFPYDPIEKRRYAYTAVTRAAKQVVLVI